MFAIKGLKGLIFRLVYGIMRETKDERSDLLWLDLQILQAFTRRAMRAVLGRVGWDSVVKGEAMSSRDKYGKFKKKDYIRTIRAVRDYLCEKFGYKKKPFLFETRLKDQYLMEFVHRKARYAIFYDYKQFKDTFGHRSFDSQEAYAAAITAHEMRHYYQHRQMEAKRPRESVETIALWQENERNPKSEENGDCLLECCMQPLELDAFLFEYLFGAKEFGLILLQAVANERHLKAMETLYMEYFGEIDEDLFSDEIYSLLKAREE